MKKLLHMSVTTYAPSFYLNDARPSGPNKAPLEKSFMITSANLQFSDGLCSL